MSAAHNAESLVHCLLDHTFVLLCPLVFTLCRANLEETLMSLHVVK